MTFRDLMSTAQSYMEPTVQGANPAPVVGEAAASTTSAAAAGGVSLVALFLGYKALRYFGIIPRVF